MNSDFSDLFAALNAVGARYLVVGGYALALHAEPRFTKDLDIWIDRTPENAQAVWNALAAFGAPVTEVSHPLVPLALRVVEDGVRAPTGLARRADARD